MTTKYRHIFRDVAGSPLRSNGGAQGPRVYKQNLTTKYRHIFGTPEQSELSDSLASKARAKVCEARDGRALSSGGQSVDRTAYNKSDNYI